MPLAYSYLRFSHHTQAAGDSIRRQTESRERWLAARPGVALDGSLAMTDRGRSAFKRKNWDTYALAQFLRYVESGRVEPGSYLLVENLDRLSREDAGEATELFLRLVNSGVVVVQLSPAVMEFARPVNMMQLMFAIVELSRGHSESAIKSERVRASWARRLRAAAERAGSGPQVVSRYLPGWFRRGPDGPDGRPGVAVLAGGRPVIDPERAAVVRRIFALAIAGHGSGAIAGTLGREGVPVLGRRVMKGRAVTWSRNIVHDILTTRTTIGEFTPYGASARAGKAARAGEPIPDYYPPVIDPDTFRAAQAAIRTRGLVGRGRQGRHVNLFAGLLVDARDGGPLTYKHDRRHSLVAPRNPIEGRGGVYASFPAGPFEAAVTQLLAEVRAADVQEGGGEEKRKVEALAGRLAEAEEKVRWYGQKCDEAGGEAEMAVYGPKAVEWERRRKGLAAEVADAQRDAASPLAESLGEFRSLAEVLAADPSDENRVRVRGALRRAVESVLCLFAGRTRTRVGLVQVWFRGGGCRQYLIRHWAAYDGGGRRPRWPARTDARAFAEAVVPGDLDLRDAGHARQADEWLGRLAAAAEPARAARGPKVALG